MAKMNQDRVILKNCKLIFQIFREMVDLAEKLEYQYLRKTSVSEGSRCIFLPIQLQAQTLAHDANVFLELTLRTNEVVNLIGLDDPLRNKVTGAVIYKSYRLVFADLSETVFDVYGLGHKESLL